MTTDITVPQLGESVTEATVAKWFKAVGDAVAQDEPLVELETDKVTVEVPSPAAGTLIEILAEPGAEVEVGALLARLGEGAAAPAPKPAAASAPAPAAPAPAAPTPAAPAPTPAPLAKAANTALPLAPAVRKLVADNALDPARIPATGKDGRLTRDDVVRYMQAGGAAAPAPALAAGPGREAGPREEKVKMTRLRRRVAERLKDAQNTAAILTTFNEVDMTAIMELRNRYKDAFEKKHAIKLGFMSFFVKACVSALKELPAVNAEISGDSILYKNYYDIGVAVGGPQGLVVPVVRDCDTRSFAEVEGAIAGFGRKARDGSLTLEEMSGGTFTISNGGVYGSLMSTPILNPPQSAILGMHKTQMRPMVMPDGSIQARPMMYLALSYDHRIIDGKEAVTFLVRVKEAIENPARLLLDV
ncbi:2-oxoglutarate dehydrogenase complex dihydrolipoyllysine-residue succinyltransferase [Pararhodospirillum oryzae]|uniref:Dihydrolipoyllysine-residue succinyltransferase component of 2-oxoglutarate dehydrogenase complex n=1 Tax=Pararhodospirillum oryzae TaxID=478448 RepID=A0A512H7S3_9PROT|nr:2-oxoglutarate dehydrogenase complex dihydrolipoyllysine-residue succinyltransferase [Pararhodospirillum oryzae]GEO81507.1 dihydrolipoyllysine-residue succinyltransferase component of 2-oxoglutarate dehydrogenase complex [Pararhodospirillum oryzae]